MKVKISYLKGKLDGHNSDLKSGSPKTLIFDKFNLYWTFIACEFCPFLWFPGPLFYIVESLFLRSLKHFHMLSESITIWGVQQVSKSSNHLEIRNIEGYVHANFKLHKNMSTIKSRNKTSIHTLSVRDW